MTSCTILLTRLFELHTGPIFAGSTPSSPLQPQTQISSTNLGLELQKARHDPKVKAVVLRVDSPGAAAPDFCIHYCSVWQIRCKALVCCLILYSTAGAQLQHMHNMAHLSACVASKSDTHEPIKCYSCWFEVSTGNTSGACLWFHTRSNVSLLKTNNLQVCQLLLETHLVSFCMLAIRTCAPGEYLAIQN